MDCGCVDGVVVLGVPQSGLDRDHLVCKQLSRAEGQLPRWMHAQGIEPERAEEAVEGGRGHSGSANEAV